MKEFSLEAATIIKQQKNRRFIDRARDESTKTPLSEIAESKLSNFSLDLDYNSDDFFRDMNAKQYVLADNWPFLYRSCH
jgi:hypothetical protein